MHDCLQVHCSKSKENSGDNANALFLFSNTVYMYTMHTVGLQEYKSNGKGTQQFTQCT